LDPRTRFLLSSAASAAVTANALRPATRFGRGSSLEFLLGMPTAEMPLHALAFQAALASLTGRGGGVRGWRGAAGLGLVAASAAGLWRLHRDGEQAQEVLERALIDGLGEDYQQRIGLEHGPLPPVALSHRSVLLPDLRSRRRYVAPTAQNLPYGEAGRRNHLDVWRRTDLPADGRAPVLVQVHGGAWIMGQKEGQAHPLMAHLAERGWVCVTINYRLSPRATWPDHIVDVKRAIAWTRANIGEHGGDPANVVITGGSAGGHLAALAALTPGLPAFQPGFEDADTSVTAAVPFYGVYDFTARDGVAIRALEPLLTARVFKTSLADDRSTWELASPMSHVGPDAPPFFLLHGTNDTVVPVEQGRSFASMLREVSCQPVVFAELPRAQHAFDVLPSIRVHHTVHAIERFLAVVRSTPAAVPPDRPVAADQA
jgi:acetyl esterase/lipase